VTARTPLLILLALLAIVSAAAGQERVISKPDADMIFSFSQADWERYVRQLAPPDGWTLRLQPHDTGTAIARFQRLTGVGASVQPLYIDDKGPPEMLIVASYYPRTVLRITDQVVKKIVDAARLRILILRWRKLLKVFKIQSSTWLSVPRSVP